MADYSLYLVTGSYDYDDQTFLQIVEEACQAGVTIVQLREKTGTTQAIYQKALKVKAITDRYGIPLIIDDRVDICLAVDAAGVHIGEDELPVHVVRGLIGPTKILGVSAKTTARAQQAEQEGADYLGTGAMFETQTKQTPVTSFETLQAVIQAVKIPVVAIGGIKEDNLASFQDMPIAGVAIVSEIMKAIDVKEKVQALQKKVAYWRSGNE